MLVMRNMVRLFMLLLSTLFASGVYALLSEAVGLDDADNLRKDKTFANVFEYLLMNDLYSNDFCCIRSSEGGTIDVYDDTK